MLLSRFSVKVGLEDADWQGEIVLLLSACSQTLEMGPTLTVCSVATAIDDPQIHFSHSASQLRLW